MADDQLDVERDRVALLAGRCLLNFQLYEQGLKALLSRSVVVIREVGGEPRVKDQGDRVARQTLGGLVNEYLNTVLVKESPDPLEGPEPDLSEGVVVQSATRIAMPPEEHDRLQAALRDLVRSRNDLVHHFTARHDMATPEGCKAAQADLEAMRLHIIGYLADLKDIAGRMANAQRALADALASPEVQLMIIRASPPALEGRRKKPQKA
jgi:hypothetical protein